MLLIQLHAQFTESAAGVAMHPVACRLFISLVAAVGLGDGLFGIPVLGAELSGDLLQTSMLHNKFLD